MEKYNVKEWVNKLIDAKKYKLPISTAAYSITVLEFLKDWYDNTDEQTLVLCRDNIDFGIRKILAIHLGRTNVKTPI